MCVIMLVGKTRPTEEMVERAWDHNKDGMGFAYREGGKLGADVIWHKGIMELKECKELIKDLPSPYVLHFRVASVGGVKPSLTHPFIVNREASLHLQGRTRGAVLFHNGHWSQWNDRALEAAIHSNNRVPLGSDWSDSRAMAWMISIYGPGFMELLTSQRGILMSPKQINIFTGNGWEEINGVWCSNDNFWRGKRHNHSNGAYSGYKSKTCSVGRCSNNAMYNKDICWECERKQEQAARIANSTNNDSTTTANTASPVEIVTGGTNRPLAKVFTMAQVETFYKEKRISKSVLKKFRKSNGALSERGNRALRAQKTLEELSVGIAEKLLAGSSH